MAEKHKYLPQQLCFRVRGRYAMFTEPSSKIGGDKCSYQIPTYDALIGITKSIYFKPTLIWYIDAVRILNPIRTECKNIKLLKFDGKPDLAVYTYLRDVAYQVLVHFEWNEHRPEFEKDRNCGKHFEIMRAMINKGGRRDIFLGTRECQGYVEPCDWRGGEGAYDNAGEIGYGIMFHGFDYPDETGENKLQTRFWRPVMKDGIVTFLKPKECDEKLKRFIRKLEPKAFKQFSGLEEPGLRDEISPQEPSHELD